MLNCCFIVVIDVKSFCHGDKENNGFCMVQTGRIRSYLDAMVAPKERNAKECLIGEFAWCKFDEFLFLNKFSKLA